MLKRLLIIVSLSLIGLTFLIWLFNFLTTGKIVITAGSNNSIQLSKVGVAKFSISSKGKLSANLKSGDYIANVQGSSTGSSQSIKPALRHTISYNLTPLSTYGVQPVVSANAYSIHPSATNLTFVDFSSQALYKLD